MTQLFYYHQLNDVQRKQAAKLSCDMRPEWQCYLVNFHGDVTQSLPLAPVFRTGTVRIGEDARRQLAALDRAEVEFIVRHAIGDWSEMTSEERAFNELAIEEGEPVVSRYAIGDLAQVYVTTPADRTSTRLLFSTHGVTSSGLQ